MNRKNLTKISMMFVFCLSGFKVDSATIQFLPVSSNEGRQSRPATEAEGDILLNFTSKKEKEVWNPLPSLWVKKVPVCPEGSPKSSNAPLMERAVCPWYFKESYDEDRYPNLIKEAVCLCDECLKVGHCEASYANVPTWRKSKGGNFWMQTLKVAVACNCIFGQKEK